MSRRYLYNSNEHPGSIESREFIDQKMKHSITCNVCGTWSLSVGKNKLRICVKELRGWWGKLMDLITRDSFQLIFLQAQPKHTYSAYSPNKSMFSHHSSYFLSFWLHCLIQFLWQAEYYRTTSLIKSERISNSSKSINKSARLST